jgi:hypothetical protein
MADEKPKEKGLIRGIVEVFSEKMKELEPKEAAVVFIILSIVFVFGLTGFTSAIASGIVKMIQIIPQVAGTITI